MRDTVRPTIGSLARSPLAHAIVSLVAVLGCAAAFYLPALQRTHGYWPAPLDDVYIHFDFARSTAEGRPFSWLAGNGYSSGGTSLTYPLILGLGYLVGFRDRWLGVFAALVAVVSLVDLSHSLRRVAARSPIALVFPLILLAVPLLDWTWFSGMEVALAGALAGRALASSVASSRAAPHRRRRLQLGAGIYAALLAVTRPECAVFSFALAVAVAYRGASLGAARSLARAGGPTLLVLGAQALLNRCITGDFAAAGAVRKLVTELPYASRTDVVIAFLTNVARLRTEGLDLGLGGSSVTVLLVLVALSGTIVREARAWSLALFTGAVGSFALVCLNTTAPFQNMRYLAPTFAFLLSGACLSVDALARRGRVARIAALVLAGALVLGPSLGFARQIDHFARSSRNIVEQQVEVGKRLGALSPPPRRVFLNDAGAIPYVSRLGAMDGLGLGGFHQLPFARASVAGGPAVIELIERLPPEERPDVFAIYDGWWPDLVPRFGRPLFEVTIDDNVICGAPTKKVYAADWSLLEDRRSGDFLDRLDVGDLVDEASHRLAFSRVHEGYVIGAVASAPDGRPRYDAGRIFREGVVVRFRLEGRFSPGRHTLRLRTDGGHDADLRITLAPPRRSPEEIRTLVEGQEPERWAEIDLQPEWLGPGTSVEMVSVHGPLRLFAVEVLP